jgi:glutathione S-transferase
VLQILGSRTSPFVRRVRVVATELGVPFALIDTTTDAGLRRLTEISPIAKIPVALFGAEVVLDSHTIVDRLLAEHGYGPLRPPADPAAEIRIGHVIDGALDAAINAFYLRKDGVAPGTVAYVDKQDRRVDSALSWLEAHWRPDHLGIPEIAAITMLDWMAFRSVRDLTRWPTLAALQVAHHERPSFADTRPGQ